MQAHKMAFHVHGLVSAGIRMTYQSLAVEQCGAAAVADGPVCEAQNVQDLLRQ